MLPKKVLDEMNVQINKELYSAYLYLAMAAHFEGANLPGFAHWMKAQAAEEQAHAMKFFEYIYERGGAVTLDAIAKPDFKPTGPKAAFDEVLKHEQYVTSRIHTIYAAAVDEKDYASQVFLQWFIKEQVEEEKNATQIVEMLKMAGEHGNALFIIDHHLADRK
jgi:ferritin